MDKKSKYRINLGEGGDILHEELTPVEFFNRIIGLRHRYNPTFSVFDEESNDWTCFQSTAIEPVTSGKGKKHAKEGATAIEPVTSGKGKKHAKEGATR